VRPDPRLAARLAALARRYDERWLDTDPVRWPRAASDPADREVTAVVAALLAYGRVASIHRAVEGVLDRLDGSPARALDAERREEIPHRLASFRPRFTSGADLAWVLLSVARARDEAGSLGAWLAARASGPQPLRAALAAWSDLAALVPADPAPARVRARRFLLADPRGGSACKRSLLLARWCVREDDGVDLGLWSHAGLAPADLLVPLDTHVARTARDLGLTRRRTVGWETAVEVTRALAALDPRDPVRFDFALARPGIVGRCRHRPLRPVCDPCDLRDVCVHGRRVARGRGPTTSRRTSGSRRTRPSPGRSSRTTGP
jgi:uncharacterized protein (TIGR02757 family)